MQKSKQPYITTHTWPRLHSFDHSSIIRDGLDQAGSGQEQVAGTCDCGKELSGSIKGGKFLD
jgi:hypothetical protein